MENILWGQDMNIYKITLFFKVGNKDDDSDRKVVLTQDANKFADQMGIQLFETSAKENKNVEEVRFNKTFSHNYRCKTPI
jgi:hypothetical protein